MKKEFIKRISIAVNRSLAQTTFLLDLLDYDLFKYLELEEKLKNNFVGYCPGDLKECKKILAMGNGSEWFRISFITINNIK